MKRSKRMINDLKPCPLCKSEAYVSTISHECEPDGYGVDCSVCGCQVNEYETIEQAIAAWNTRVESNEIPDWLKEKIDQGIEYGKVNEHTHDRYKYLKESLKWVLSLRRDSE
jgi:hypothetical protein